MPAPSKRVREQVVVYLEARDRELLENLASSTGLSRTELFRRGLWALAAQTSGTKSRSAFDALIATAGEFDGPSDYSEHSDDYLYGGKALRRRVAEETGTPTAAESASATSKKRGTRARPR